MREGTTNKILPERGVNGVVSKMIDVEHKADEKISQHGN